MKSVGQAVLSIFCLVSFSSPSFAQITDQQAINYIKNAWELTDLSDDVIRHTLDTSYSGIPFKEYVSYFIAAPGILNPLSAGDYKTAGKKAADLAAGQLISHLLKQAGLAGVAAPARLATWPIEHSLDNFYQAVVAANFKKEMALYFEAREFNSYSAIVNLPPAELLEGVTITKSDQGWLMKQTSYFGYGAVPGYKPEEFFEYAEFMWQAQKAYTRYNGDQSVVRDAFHSAALPAKPVIVQQPQDAVIAANQSVALTVVATGSGPFQYVWERNGLPFAGPFGATFNATVAGEYRVTVYDVNQLFTKSRIATVTVNSGEPTAITAPTAGATLAGIVIVRATANDATKMEFYLDGVRQFTDSAPPFAWTWNTALTSNNSHSLTAKAYQGATLLGASAAVNVTVNNVAPTSCPDLSEPNETSSTAPPLALNVPVNGYICTATDVDWFRIDVSTPGIHTFNLVIPASNDYDLELYGPNGAYLTGSYRDIGLAENIVYNAIATGIYYLRVYGYPLGSGSHNIDVSYTLGANVVAGPITILSPPQHRAVPVGASASFTVAATGALPITYQWQRNGSDIPGATNDTYVLYGLNLADSGTQFRVRVANGFGAVISESATLTVNSANAITWTGAVDGNWFNAANWTPMTVPNASDTVIVNSGNVMLFTNSAYAVLVFNGGMLSGTTRINGTMVWSGGTITGPVTISQSGTLNVVGPNPKHIYFTQLVNNGTITQSSPTQILFTGSPDNPSLISIAAGATYIVEGDGTIFDSQITGFVGRINNAGTFRKTTGNGTSAINVPFDNSGTIQISSGTLELSGGTSTGGNFVFANGSRLRPKCQYYIVGTQTGNGDGALEIPGLPSTAGCTVGAPAGQTATLNFTGSSRVELKANGGVGWEGQTVNTGNFTWSGGSISNNGLVNASNSFTIVDGDRKYIHFSQLTNNGTITQSSTTWILFSGWPESPSVLNNSAGALYDLQGDGLVLNSGGYGYYGRINNAGTFRKSTGSGTSSINPAFDNTGSVQINSGILELSGGGTSTNGTFAFANSSRLRLNCLYSVVGTQTGTGDGALEIPGLPSTGGCTVGAPAGQTARLNFTGSSRVELKANGGVGWEGQTINTGNFTWSGGSVYNAGLVNESNSFTIVDGDQKRIFFSQLINHGTITQSGTTPILFLGSTDNPSLISNPAGATYDVQGAGVAFGPYNDASGYGRFDNSGTFRKSTGSGTSSINVPFDNTGTVQISSGTLAVSGGTSTGGNFVFANGGRFRPNCLYYLVGMQTGTGDGALEIPGLPNTGGCTIGAPAGQTARLNFFGNSGVELKANGGVGREGQTINVGNFNWSGGSVYNAGLLNESNSFAIVDGDQKRIFFSQLINHGTITQSGTTPILFLGSTDNPSLISNPTGATYDVQGDGVAFAPYNIPNGDGRIDNGGTFRKSSGGGTSILSNTPFTNTGTVEVQAGTLKFESGTFTQNSGETRLVGGSLSGGTFHFTGGTLAGSGTVNGEVVNAGVLSPGSSPGRITINGNYTQAAGGVLQLELGGLTPGTGFDQLVVTGQATLAGALNVTLINGFVPGPSDSFTISTYASRLGSFAAVNLPALLNTYSLQYNATGLTLLSSSPTITGISPSFGTRGTSLPATLSGFNLGGATGVVFSGTGVTATITGGGTAISLPISITIDGTALTGGRTVSVTTPSGSSNTLTFTVNLPSPTLTHVSPSFGLQGTAVPVTLLGTNFVVGETSVAVSGSEISVSNISVASPTQLTAVFAIPDTASSGARNITVTTSGGTSDAISFTVAVPPICRFTMSKAVYVPGDALTIQSLKVENTLPVALLAEYKFWIDLPDGSTYMYMRGGEDDSVTLAAGLLITDVLGGPKTLGIVDTAFPPKGAYGINCRLEDPTTGKDFAEDRTTFTVQ